MLGRLLRDRRGSTPIIFGLLLVPIIALTGGAVDYGKAIADRARINNMLDAAVIVGAKQAQADDAKNLPDATIIANAQTAATTYFNTTGALPGGAKPTFTAKLSNRSVVISGSYSATAAATFLKVVGFDEFAIGGKASSTIDLSPMVDIHLLIDVSGSMALGATAADVAKLNATFRCAFACHDGVKVLGTNLDAFQWTQSNGVTLRLNEINTGILDFVTWLRSQASSTRRIRMATYAFSNSIDTIVPITSNLTRITANLPAAPDVSGEYDGATHFKEIAPTLAASVGASGDGVTTPKKLVIIATDGVQDPNRTWTWNLPLRAQVAPFSPSDCRKIDSSVSVGVLYAPYLKMPWDWGYNATLGQPSQIGNSGARFDDIVPQLKKCATSSNLFVDLSTTTSVGAAFASIFQSFTQARLSK